ncbi:PREDICTED: MADS-box transcription factor PHERES 2-like [Camelina sativa]|uniref:MADS-box transcription factor PHERES 2-like n=1 Tax=Camelina sativa TaxID=90675 RepID=A0ABM0Y1X5_CAMSA|nr:PREDICTED: MADS-box transcription factor PHERES 2-like [Camelina sativa]
MWGCLKGKIDVHKLGEKDMRDLSSIINGVVVRVGYFDHEKQNQNQKELSQPQNELLNNFNMNVDLDLNLKSKQNMILDLDQISNVEKDEDIPSMEGSHHKPETVCLATTVADVCAPTNTNNLNS